LNAIWQASAVRSKSEQKLKGKPLPLPADLLPGGFLFEPLL